MHHQIIQTVPKVNSLICVTEDDVSGRRGPTFGEDGQPSDVTVFSRGHPVVLECQVTASPQPNYKWLRNRSGNVTDVYDVNEEVGNRFHIYFDITLFLESCKSNYIKNLYRYVHHYRHVLGRKNNALDSLAWILYITRNTPVVHFLANAYPPGHLVSSCCWISLHE